MLLLLLLYLYCVLRLTQAKKCNTECVYRLEHFDTIGLMVTKLWYKNYTFKLYAGQCNGCQLCYVIINYYNL